MKTYRYPLLCWSLGELVCAQVVGTEYTLAHARLERIRQQASEQLQRDYRDDHWLPDPIVEPELMHIAVSVRPAYRQGNRRYPIEAPWSIPVSAVYGTTEDGDHECYLPLLDQQFYYYQPEQLRQLIEHFAREHFDDSEPEALAAYLLAPRPWLEEVVVRLDDRRLRTERKPVPTEQLERVADRFPAQTRRIGIAPDVVWERDALVGEVVERLEREGTSLLLVGEAGIGKSAILASAVRRWHSQSRAAGRDPKPAWRTTPDRLIAGARYLGEWQAQCEEVIAELTLSGHLLWITDLLRLFQVGGDGPQDSVASFILPSIVRGDIQLIGEVSPAQLDVARRLLPAFVAQMHLSTVPPLEAHQIHTIGAQFAEYCQRNRAIGIDTAARQTALRLCRRFQRQRALPGALLELLGRCVAEAQQTGAAAVDEERVLDSFRRQSGMAAILLRDDIPLDLERIRADLAARLIGQADAIATLARVIAVFKAGMDAPDRPIATLLFAGPTGVGKTQAAKLLAEFFYGQGQVLNPMIRLDMSEFQHPAQIDRLIGSGAHPGKLVREIRERPFGMVLLDEIEKAHPAFFDILLNLLDEGRLVDDLGQVTDFRNAIVIMTSNLGSGGRSVGFVDDGGRDHLAAVREFFRPEFFNRIDEVIAFRPLGHEAIRQITRLELEALSRRQGIAERGIRLEFADELIDALGRIGFDPQLGARPLQRAIEDRVMTALARWLLVNPQVDRLRIEWSGEAVVIETA